MTHKLPTHPRNWLLLAGLGLLYLLLSGCASQPKETLRARTDTTSEARAAVVQIAQHMLGAPYRAGGSNPRGFDCSGLSSFSYGNAGIDIPRTAADQFLSAQPVGQRQLQPGDLVFFNTEGRKISHVGIYVGEGQFVHAPGAGKRVSLDSLNDTYWRRRIRGSGHYFNM